MTNQNVSNIQPKYNFKYGVKINEADYIKTKNKQYYSEIKSNPTRAKSTLINYYKKKYGVEFVLDAIEKLGLPNALSYLRNYKYEMKVVSIENPFITLSAGITA